MEGNGSLMREWLVYQEEERDFFWTIPWDLNSTLITTAWNGYPPRWNDFDIDCETYQTLAPNGIKARPANCDPLTRALALVDAKRYYDAVDTLLDTLFTEEAINKGIDALIPILTPAVARDQDRTIDAWHGHIEDLKKLIPFLRERLTRLRDGESVKPIYIDPEAVNGFESMNDVTLKGATFAWANPSSNVFHHINNENPISGREDLRVEMTYRTEANTPYSQWSILDLPMECTVAFSALNAIRISIRADRQRRVGVSLF
jgi:hypothetical protein